MIHCHERFGCEVSELRVLPGGVAKTLENLEAAGVSEPSSRRTSSLRTYRRSRYDVVLSLGFIEHFRDPAPMLTATR